MRIDGYILLQASILGIAGIALLVFVLLFALLFCASLWNCHGDEAKTWYRVRLSTRRIRKVKQPLQSGARNQKIRAINRLARYHGNLYWDEVDLWQIALSDPDDSVSTSAVRVLSWTLTRQKGDPIPLLLGMMSTEWRNDTRYALLGCQICAPRLDLYAAYQAAPYHTQKLLLCYWGGMTEEDTEFFFRRLISESTPLNEQLALVEALENEHHKHARPKTENIRLRALFKHPSKDLRRQLAQGIFAKSDWDQLLDLHLVLADPELQVRKAFYDAVKKIDIPEDRWHNDACQFVRLYQDTKLTEALLLPKDSLHDLEYFNRWSKGRSWIHFEILIDLAREHGGEIRTWALSRIYEWITAFAQYLISRTNSTPSDDQMLEEVFRKRIGSLKPQLQENLSGRLEDAKLLEKDAIQKKRARDEALRRSREYKQAQLDAYRDEEDSGHPYDHSCYRDG